ncbi:MAG: M15 family metallopeptidase [Cyclobacteriaceae bacterium]|nr:M15 family metallopeptidase [Cyclobacteriaceae bacterium HetDA_MAG_MS6]
MSIVFLGISWISVAQEQLPLGFVYVDDVIPDIAIELRYYSNNNFVGDTIDGYLNERLIISQAAATALLKVQKDLKEIGLKLKIFDGYRPQKAVNHFVRWAQNLPDTSMKSRFYPNVDKSNLFKLGYIASKSGHTRGSTLDLTIIDQKTGVELDMGGPFDFFGPISHHSYQNLSPIQLSNRKLLKSTMLRYGFRSYSKEWWHYTLNNEPFPDRYFDFDVH